MALIARVDISALADKLSFFFVTAEILWLYLTIMKVGKVVFFKREKKRTNCTLTSDMD